MAFFDSVFDAGTILCGFCGTFLSFRIQREATYYRQPALNFESAEAKDIFIGLTHFTVAFLLLILATVSATIFGFILPLFAIAGARWVLNRPNLVLSGLVATVVLLCAYYWAELAHYQIVSRKLTHDKDEWRGECLIAILGISLGLISAVTTYILFSRH